MLTSLYERIRDSLFLLPASLIVGLGLFAWVARRLDGVLPPAVPWLLQTTVDSTRAILSTVATATITVAAIVFSMTAVVVQLATSQFSPRVTQGFLRERNQQVTIGFTVGTFVYALLVLSNVRGSEDLPFTSHDFSATAAVALAVVSMILIVHFIDRIMRSMRIDTIIRRLADSTESAVEGLPEREPQAADGSAPHADPGSTVAVTRTGWVRWIDIDQILAAVPEQTAVRIDLRIGDFITHGEVAARVWPEVADEVQQAIAGAITVDRTRSISSDPSYGIRQLVDIALRAFSPSLNDATTGSDVIRHLGGPLQTILQRSLPGRVAGDEEGRRIYLPRVMTHSDYVHAAFREIRINANGEPYALHALIETLASLIGVVASNGLEGRTAALREEADATIEMIRHSDMAKNDKDYLLDFARRVGLIDEDQ